jgi:hypothetical protein
MLRSAFVVSSSCSSSLIFDSYVGQMQLSFSWFALFEINPFLLVFQSLTLCVYMFQLASVFM